MLNISTIDESYNSSFEKTTSSSPLPFPPLAGISLFLSSLIFLFANLRRRTRIRFSLRVSRETEKEGGGEGVEEEGGDWSQ